MNLTNNPVSRDRHVPVWKRAIDLAASLLLLVTLGPVALLSALAVLLTMGRPIVFSQRRTGLYGGTFQVSKLRTMVADRRHDPAEKVPLSHPDITPLGHLLRRFKIDEVPQLLAVLKGDMSLIGPRPALPEQSIQYDDFAKQRLRVRPGLTGLAQINGGSLLPWSERIKYDVYYVHNLSPFLDLWILVKTVAVVVLGESRYVRLYKSNRNNLTSRAPCSTFK